MVSVIVPVYNSEEKISRCIESVLAQTYGEFELILVNDGSTDSSLDICRRYEKADSRVRVISNENQGVSKARNMGIKCARGEYIQFMDSDDYMCVDMLQNLVQNIKETNADIVISGYKELRHDTTKNILPDYEGKIEIKNLQTCYANIFDKAILNAVWNKLYKRTNILQLKFSKDLSLGEDLMFNLQHLNCVKTVSFVRKALYVYDIREESLNTKYRENNIEIAEKIYIECINFANQVGLGKQATIDVSTTFLQYFFYGMLEHYVKTDLTDKELRNQIKNWVYNPNICQVVKYAHMKYCYQKIAKFFVKYKMVFLLHVLFTIKRFIFKMKRRN